VDDHYGIRAERVITLHASEARMTIETTYAKVKGEPQRVGIWIITQLREPDDVRIAVTAEKYVRQTPDLPMDLRFAKDGLHLKRNPSKNTKIGTDASLLEWRDKRWTLRIESKRVAGEEYPDEGSSAEVYTNMNPLTFVELEMLGPLKTLRAGDTIAQLNRYELARTPSGD
jgi:hypothetical protein